MKKIEWFEKPIEQYMAEFMKAHGRGPDCVELPFDLPDDIRNYRCFQENDYLRLSKHPRVLAAQAAVAQESGTGKLSSGGYYGHGTETGKLCRLLAESLQCESAVLTTAGWTANVGLMEALMPPDKCIYIDIKAHASLWAAPASRTAGLFPLPTIMLNTW